MEREVRKEAAEEPPGGPGSTSDYDAFEQGHPAGGSVDPRAAALDDRRRVFLAVATLAGVSSLGFIIQGALLGDAMLLVRNLVIVAIAGATVWMALRLKDPAPAYGIAIAGMCIVTYVAAAAPTPGLSALGMAYATGALAVFGFPTRWGFPLALVVGAVAAAGAFVGHAESVGVWGPRFVVAYACLVGLLSVQTWRDKSLRESLFESNQRLETAVQERTAQLKASLKSLRLADSELSAALAVKNAVLRHTSHEVATPATIILGNAERLLAKADDLSTAQVAALEQMADAASRLGSVTRQLGEAQALEEGLLSRGLTTRCRVYDVLHPVISDVEEVAEAAGLTFVAHVPTDVTVEWVGRRIQRAVREVLANAAAFTPEGGRFGLRVLQSSGGSVVMEVWDEGPGIPSEVRDRVFAPFVQAVTSYSRPHDGLGLGLTTARAAVEDHGGTIELGDAEEGGLLVRIEMPERAVALAEATA